MKKSEKRPEATQPQTKVCNRCHTEKDINEFRTHKSGYVLNQCRSCEKAVALARSRSKKGIPAPIETDSPSIFTITTKKGKEYKVTTETFSGARMVTNGEHTLYFPVGTSKDASRSAFSSYYGSSTGISTKIVE
jgi:hypothetical protein